MRLRNIPGAKDAILECDWVIDEPERFKGKWESFFIVCCFGWCDKCLSIKERTDCGTRAGYYG